MLSCLWRPLRQPKITTDAVVALNNLVESRISSMDAWGDCVIAAIISLTTTEFLSTRMITDQQTLTDQAIRDRKLET